MQWYEYGLLALILVGAASVLVFAPRTWMRWVYVVAVGLVLWGHFNTEGVHWQVAPLYLAIGILVVLQFALLNDYDEAPVIRAGAWISVACCLLAVAFSITLPMFDLPKPTGPYAVGVYTGVMSDRSRGADGLSAANRDNFRDVAVQFWYPAVTKTGYGRGRYAQLSELKPRFSYKAQIRTNSWWQATPIPDQTFPVVLLEPMWNGARVQDTFLAEDLASHGYIVVAVDHPYNAALVDTTAPGVTAGDRAHALDVGPGTSPEAILATWAKELEIWTADNEFVMTQLDLMTGPKALNGFSWGTPQMDLTHVAAVGHSFGGASSIALLGTDPRIKAAVNLDGWTFNAIDKRTTQPILFVYEAVSETRKTPVDTDSKLDAIDNAAIDASLQHYGGLRAYVAGTQHLDFTDQTLVSPFQRLTHTGPIKGERIRTITRALVLGFLDQTLKGKGNIPAYPEVKMEALRRLPN